MSLWLACATLRITAAQFDAYRLQMYRVCRL